MGAKQSSFSHARKTIQVRVSPGGPTLPWRELRKYRRNTLKARTVKSLDKLCAAILERGFCFPVFVWAGHDYVIDGAGRVPALERLEKAGHKVPEEVPVSLIEAKDEKEAAELVLLASSHHGEVSEASLTEFAELHALQLVEMEKLIEFQGIEMERLGIEAPGGSPIGVEEIPVGPLTLRFVVVLSGPMVEQPQLLQAIYALQEQFSELEIESV